MCFLCSGYSRCLCEKDNDGYKFENIMYTKLKQSNLFDEVVYERELASRLGWGAAGVDFLLVRKDEMILLQIKWRKSRRRENFGIINFMKAIDYVVNSIKDKKYAFGLYISRREPFCDNINQLRCKNVHCLSEYNSMVDLATQTVDFLKEKVVVF